MAAPVITKFVHAILLVIIIHAKGCCVCARVRDCVILSVSLSLCAFQSRARFSSSLSSVLFFPLGNAISKTFRVLVLITNPKF